MTQTWDTVRIFISSTFRDMQAERDTLVRFVFPELRERCAKRQLHLVDVDLRWGITKEQELQGQALAVCLDEIENCRPFFVGLLGERYGEVPSHYDVPNEPRYDWLRGFEPGHSFTALEIYQGVLSNPSMTMRAFFYFRDPGFLRRMPGEHQAAFLDENPEGATRIVRLKQAIRRQYPVFEYQCDFQEHEGEIVLTGLETLSQRVLEDLWSAICLEHPKAKEPPNELAVERAFHEAFAEACSKRYVGRLDLQRKLCAHAESQDAVPLVVTGGPGTGKSALLARFARDYARAHPSAFVLAHFVGVSPGSTDIRRTLRRLCCEVAERLGLTEDIPEDYVELRRRLPLLLEKLVARGKAVLILDGLDQLDETHNAHALGWLPQRLPSGLCLILSSQPGTCLDALHHRRPPPDVVTVSPLAIREREQLVKETLAEYRKALSASGPEDQMALLLGKDEAGNPLYLTIACEELRVFGDFERLTEYIANLPENVESLLEQVLERLEGDHGRELVESALSLLVCSRHGLLESEILELLCGAGEPQLPRAVWARLYRSLKPYLRPPAASSEGAIDFFHRQVAVAARRRYLSEEVREIAAHERLASYFRVQADPTGKAMWDGDSPRGLGELPYHLLLARHWPELEATLCDLGYVQARCKAGTLFGLLEDCDRASATGEVPGASQVRKALSLALPGLTTRPELARQLVYNHLIWFQDRAPALTEALNMARTNLNHEAFWIRAEAPLPASGIGASSSFPLRWASAIQAVSPTEDVVAVGIFSGEVALHRISNGELLEERSLPIPRPAGITLSRSGGSLACLSLDAKLVSEQGTDSLQCRPGERILLDLWKRGILAVRDDDSLVAWQPASTQCTIIAPGLPEPLVRLCASPDGEHVLFVAGQQQSVIGLASWTSGRWVVAPIAYRGAPVLDADVHWDARLLLLACSDRALRVIKLGTQELEAELFYEQRPGEALIGAPARCALGQGESSGRAYFGTSEGQVACWNWREDALVRLEDYPIDEGLVRLDAMPSGKVFLSTPQRGQLLSYKSLYRPANRHSRPVSDCCITQSETVASFSSADRTVRWFTAQGLTPLALLEAAGPTALARHSDRDTIFLGNRQGAVWEQAPAAEIARDIRSFFVDQVESLFHVAEATVLAASRSGSIVQIDLDSRTLEPVRSGTGFEKQIKILPAHAKGLCWSLREEATTSGTRTLLYLIHSRGHERRVLEGAISDAAVSEDGSTLCVAGPSVQVLRRGLRGWRTIYRRNTAARLVTFLGSGQFIAVALGDTPWIEVWRLGPGLPTVAATHLPDGACCLSALATRIVVGTSAGSLLSLRLCVSSQPGTPGLCEEEP